MGETDVRGIDRIAIAFFFCVAFNHAVIAQDDPLPGIVVEYAPDGSPSWMRIEHEIGHRLDSGLPSLINQRFPLTMTWHGYWLPDGRGPHRWLLSGSGKATLDLGGIPGSPMELKESASVSVGFDAKRADWTEFRLKVTFADPSGWVRVAWDGPGFPPEPLPLYRLGHDPHEEAQRTTMAERLITDLRCAACHQGFPALSASATAPDLARRVALTDRTWIKRRIVDHFEIETDQSPLPSAVSSFRFGIPEQELDDLVCFLISQVTPETIPSPEDHTPLGDNEKGEFLLGSLGCTACHTPHDATREDRKLGFGLERLGERRTLAFLDRWLIDPAIVDPHASMPILSLSDAERADLLAAIASRSQTQPEINLHVDQQSAARGARIFQQWRCGHCHLPQSGSPDLPFPGTANTGCLADSETPVSASTPHLRLAPQEREALQSFLNRLKEFKSPAAETLIPYGSPADLLHARHCFRCHDRARRDDASRTRDRALAGLTSETRDRWRAPSLDSLGDKFREDALRSILIDGSQRRDWLTLRMPRHSFRTGSKEIEDREISRIVNWLRTIDRLDESLVSPPIEVSDSEALPHGSRLVSSSGFGCVSCHAIGERRPKDAPVHAAGPPLDRIDQRLERVWFDRWVRSPSRLVPNMEMPSFRLPVHGVLNDDLDRQMAAVWRSLSSDDFQVAAAEPERVLRQLGDGQSRAAVVTDVLRSERRVWIAPWIAGLSNRHNVLFDGESGALRGWWIGDVARQYTEGKSWYWQQGGYPLALQESADAPSEWQLEVDDQKVSPIPKEQFQSEVEGWDFDQATISMHHRLHFPVHGETREISLRETFTPLVQKRSTDSSSSETLLENGDGFRRTLAVRPSTDLPTLHFSIEALASESTPVTRLAETQWQLGAKPKCFIRLIDLPEGWSINPDGLSLSWASPSASHESTIILEYVCELIEDHIPDHSLSNAPPVLADDVARKDVVLGFESQVLSEGTPWMPTGLSWNESGELFVSSLDGRVWRLPAESSPTSRAELLADGFAAPFGVHASDRYVDVINKTGLMRLWDRDRDGQADEVRAMARGWGHTADYHDWAIGLPQDQAGAYWVAISCRQDQRPDAAAALRGTLLRLVPLDPAKETSPYRIETMARGVRFPVGLAISREDEVYFTDNQGNYNPFNELNHFRREAHYGFLNAWEARSGNRPYETPPTVAIPHPWTRSVNGLAVLELPKEKPNEPKFGPWSGHLVACEYDTQRLIRISTETIEGVQQGAVYPFSTGADLSRSELLGPLTVGVSPHGDLIVGAIRDSGWGGGENIGRLIRLRFDESLIPPGIVDVRATRRGFRVRFSREVAIELASDPQQWTLRSYRRVSTSEYGGPDLDVRGESLSQILVADDRRTAELILAEPLRTGFLYQIETSDLTGSGVFFPAEAHYSLHAIPQ